MKTGYRGGAVVLSAEVRNYFYIYEPESTVVTLTALYRGQDCLKSTRNMQIYGAVKRE